MQPSHLTFTPPVIAYRGVRSKAPENTLAAFRQVADCGAQWFETDVKLTHDGTPIVMHDGTLDRTTNGSGPVADALWADVKPLDAGSWFGSAFKNEHVPSLAEVLRFALDKKLSLNLELKPCPGRARATAMVTLIEIAKIWPLDHPPPLISSFDIEALTVAAQLHPEWPRGLLLDSWCEDWRELATRTRCSTLHFNELVLTQNRMENLKQAELPILAYTVNEVKRAKELLHWGVSAVFSDNSQEIIRAL